LKYYFQTSEGGTPLKINWGGTGFSGLSPDPDNLPALRTFFTQGLFFAFAPYEFYDGAPVASGIPVNCGGTGCTDEGQLETLIGTKFLSGYDTNCIHAAKHKTGGSDAITPADIDACGNTDPRLSDARTPLGHSASHKTGGSDAITAADIGACGDSDSRLSDARVPLSHATTHETGGTDALTPAGIGASPVGHTHAAYLAASFDDSTNYLTIGGKVFDLSSLVVP